MNYDMNFYFPKWNETQRLVSSAENLLRDVVSNLKYLESQFGCDDFDGFAWESSLDLDAICDELSDVAEVVKMAQAFADSIKKNWKEETI